MYEHDQLDCFLDYDKQQNTVMLDGKKKFK